MDVGTASLTVGWSVDTTATVATTTRDFRDGYMNQERNICGTKNWSRPVMDATLLIIANWILMRSMSNPLDSLVG